MLDGPRELVRHLAGLLRAERRRRSTRTGTRRLSCFRQALFVLVWFRQREDIALLGARFGLSRATAHRYPAEGVAVLSAQAPDRHQALEQVQAQGWGYVILDGTLSGTDRDTASTISTTGQAIDLWYPGKANYHAGNVQALMRPDGLPVWLSPVEPGSGHDLTAARAHVLGALYTAAAHGLPTLADGGYAGAGIGVHVPVTSFDGSQVLDVDTRTDHALLRALRAPGERGFALLKTRWAALQHITACPHRISNIAHAALVLTHIEHKLIPC